MHLQLSIGIQFLVASHLLGTGHISLHKTHLCFCQQTVSVVMQDSSIEQVLSRVEDAVLILQGTPYLLAETGSLLHARRHRLPPSARVSAPCIVWAAWYITRLLVFK